jgi:hypothetical protein
MERSVTVMLLQSEMSVAPQGSLYDRNVSLTFCVEGQVI